MSEDNKFIIKMPDDAPVPEFGLGYELFEKLKIRKNDVSQYMVETDETVTFGDLLDYTIKVAINLKKLNLSEEDIVAVCSLNNKHTCVPYIAGLFNGNIVTFLDPLTIAEEKAQMLQKITPKVLFVDEDSLESVEEALRIGSLNMRVVVFGGDSSKHVRFEEYLKSSEEEIEAFRPVKVKNIERTAVIIFSSGSTGVPKGTCLSHYAILSRTSGFILPVNLIFTTPNWISYTALLVKSIREGAARVLSKYYDMTQIWNMIEKYKVNMVVGSTYQLCRMIEQPLKNQDVSSLVLVLISGSKLLHEVFLRTKQILPHTQILQPYGVTEGCGPSIIYDLGLEEEREWYKNKPESCGTPILGVWYKVVDPETEEILGPNQPGELRIKSKALMLGYYNEDSSKCFDSDGYFKTGDIVRYDEDKCFFILDRIKEMMKYRGNAVSPTMLENILTSHPSVDLAAVIGLPHAEDGDRPLGIVKLRPGCIIGAEELMEYVDENVKDKRQILAGGVKIIDDLPVKGTGKVDKRKLRDMVVSGEI